MIEAPEKLSVSQFIKRIQGALSKELPVAVIKGEVAQFTCASSGHWYFTLKDSGAQIKAVMFRQKSVRVGFLPKIGDEVEVTAVVSVYEARGELQVVCETLKKAGQGGLYEQFLRLKGKLQQEGLFDSTRKKPLPDYVFSVGVVTSAQAAAWADIQTAFERRCPHIQIRLYPSSVQGAAATRELVQAIGRADQGQHDLLIIGRGGGSLEDLWCFNEEPVVRAVASCLTPTIVGVGHESDVTLAEFAADLRAATPTAAVELCSEPTALLKDQVRGLWMEINHIRNRTFERLAQRVDRAEMALVTPQDRVALAEQKLAASWRHLSARLSNCVVAGERESVQLSLQLNKAAKRSVMESENQLGQHSVQLPLKAGRKAQALHKQLTYFENMLSAVSPQRNLDKGYAFIHRQGQSGKELVKSVQRVQSGDVLTATLADGQIELKPVDK